MKVIIEDVGPDGEEALILRCREIDESLVKLINQFKSGGQVLNVLKEGEWFRVEPKEVFYFESVDNKVFLYTGAECFEMKQKLYEIEQELGGGDFFRISKSVIANLSKMKSLAPAFNGRMEAVLKNGEKLMISRQYVGKLKEKLGL